MFFTFAMGSLFSTPSMYRIVAADTFRSSTKSVLRAIHYRQLGRELQGVKYVIEVTSIGINRQNKTRLIQYALEPRADLI